MICLSIYVTLLKLHYNTWNGRDLWADVWTDVLCIHFTVGKDILQVNKNEHLLYVSFIAWNIIITFSSKLAFPLLTTFFCLVGSSYANKLTDMWVVSVAKPESCLSQWKKTILCFGSCPCREANRQMVPHQQPSSQGLCSLLGAVPYKHSLWIFETESKLLSSFVFKSEGTHLLGCNHPTHLFKSNAENNILYTQVARDFLYKIQM